MWQIKFAQRLVSLLVLSTLSTVVAVPLAAQEFTFSVEERAVGYDPDNGVAKFRVSLYLEETDADATGFPHDVDGFSLRLTNDSDVLVPVSVEPGSALSALASGSGPETFVATLCDGQITVDSVFAESGEETLLADGRREIAVVRYRVVDGALVDDFDGLATDLIWENGEDCDSLEVENVVEVDGASEDAVFGDGLVEFFPNEVNFVRGDCNQSGSLSLIDPLFLLTALFGDGRDAPCADACDANGDGVLDISDPLYTVLFLINSAAPPPAPFPHCGVDPEGGRLGCVLAHPCASVNHDLPRHSFHPGPALDTARYGHVSVTLDDGRVLVVGGTDASFFEGLDSAEIFDPLPAPEGPDDDLRFGDWEVRHRPAHEDTPGGKSVTTDLKGDPMVMSGGARVFHSATVLEDGNVLIIGGLTDIFGGLAFGSEIFDVQAREFAPDDLEIVSDLELPRFRHTATRLADGRVLVVGGQTLEDLVIIDPNFPPGSPFFMQEITVFPSTPSMEIFDPETREFSLFEDRSGDAVELSGGTGRADHSSVAIAGEDGELGTDDDITIHAGGFNTLAGTSATMFPFWGNSDNGTVTGIDYTDVAGMTNTVAPSVSIMGRANGVHALNLGQYQASTPAGIDGVNNMVLITHGDDDGSIQSSRPTSEVLAVTFSGAGPSGGISFSKVSSGGGHSMNIELTIYGSMRSPPLYAPIGRSFAPALMAQLERVYQGERHPVSMAVTVGGVHLFPVAGGTAQGESLFGSGGAVRGVMLFDPFYNLDLDPTNLEPFITDDNPTGVSGTWLNGDAVIAEDTLYGFAGFYEDSVQPLVGLATPRAFHTANLIPGPDGEIGTPDDLILIVGGTDEIDFAFPGETVGSTEVYILP